MVNSTWSRNARSAVVDGEEKDQKTQWSEASRVKRPHKSKKPTG